MRHQISTRAVLLPLLGLAALQGQAPAQTLLKPQSAQVALGSLPMRALWALESNDLPTLAKMAHSSGVRFSSEVNVAKGDKNFAPSQIRTLARRGPIDWGLYDAESDAPFSLRWADFRRRYLWRRDFSKGKLSFNTFSERAGKVNNLRQSYTDAIFVESYVPGGARYGGMDWGSLWTVWKREGKAWKLRGIALDSQRL